jgi:hypothetical protein
MAFWIEHLVFISIAYAYSAALKLEPNSEISIFEPTIRRNRTVEKWKVSVKSYLMLVLKFPSGPSAFLNFQDISTNRL